MQHSENSGPIISVIICTYNRAEFVGTALKSLCQQTAEKTQYEVIVVDNNSEDNTRVVTEGFRRNNPNIRYCSEVRQGLSHARNRGWQEANGSYVAYIDDDCKVPTQWLNIAIEIIDQLSPAAFGGPYYAFYKSPKPYWWKDSYSSFEQSLTPRSLRRLFIRRWLLEAIGGFDSRYGMVGQKLAYGEETDLQKRIRATRPDELIYYDPKLYVWHLVRPEKMILRWILTSYFIAGRYSYHIFQGNTHQASRLPRVRLFVQAVITALRFFAEFFGAILKRDRKRFPYFQNYLYENTLEHLQTLGFIYERYIHTI